MISMWLCRKGGLIISVDAANYDPDYEQPHFLHMTPLQSHEEC